MKSQPGRVNPFINRQALKTGGRAPFMERVRNGLGHPADRSPEPAAAPVLDEFLIRQCTASDPNLIERWMERAKGNSMSVHRITAAQVTEAITGCLAKHKIEKCVLNAHDMEQCFGLEQFLASRNIAAMKWGSLNCKDAALACDASITDSRAGLADAGSLLVWSDETFGRSSTLVIPVHIVLLPASRILPDMIDGLAHVMQECGGNLPSNVVIINGPSKTADIEMNLITGVHGPKFVYVIVIDDM